MRIDKLAIDSDIGIRTDRPIQELDGRTYKDIQIDKLISWGVRQSVGYIDRRTHGRTHIPPVELDSQMAYRQQDRRTGNRHT